MTIRAALPSDREALLAIWLRSVRATHTFLTESDIQSLLPLEREVALTELEMWVLREEGEEAIGFLGLSRSHLEAQLLAPQQRRCGGGRLLVEHARRLKGLLTVDVNEPNVEAVAFYRAMGFRVVGRSPLDGDGRPFPLLHLSETVAMPQDCGWASPSSRS